MFFYYSAIWDTVLIFYNHYDSWFLYLLLPGDGHIQQHSTYRAGQGVLGRPTATAAAKEMSSHCWWMSFGAQTPELQHIAVRVLSQVTSAESWTGRHSNLFTVRNATDWHVRQSGTLLKCTANYVWWTEMKKLVIMKIMLIGLLALTQSDYWTWAFADFCAWSLLK